MSSENDNLCGTEGVTFLGRLLLHECIGSFEIYKFKPIAYIVCGVGKKPMEK